MAFYDLEGLKWDEVYCVLETFDDSSNLIYITRNLDNANQVINEYKPRNEYVFIGIVKVKLDNLMKNGPIDASEELPFRQRQQRQQVRQQMRQRSGKRRSNQVQQNRSKRNRKSLNKMNMQE